MKPKVIATRVFLRFLGDDMGGLNEAIRVHRSHIGESNTSPTFETEEYVLIENLVNGKKMVCQLVGHSNSYDRAHKDQHGSPFNRNTVVMSYRQMRKLGIRGDKEKVELIVRRMSFLDKLRNFLKREDPNKSIEMWVGIIGMVFAILTEIHLMHKEIAELFRYFLGRLF